MTIKVCDRCKRLPDEQRPPLMIARLEYQGGDFKNLNWWFGRKEELDLCHEYLEEIWNFTKK